MCQIPKIVASLVLTTSLTAVAGHAPTVTHATSVGAHGAAGASPNGCTGINMGSNPIVYNGTTVGRVTLYQDRCSLRYHGHTDSYVGNTNLYSDVRDSAGGPVSSSGFGTALDSPEVPNGSNAKACGYVQYQGSYPSACAP